MSIRYVQRVCVLSGKRREGRTLLLRRMQGLFAAISSFLKSSKKKSRSVEYFLILHLESRLDHFLLNLRLFLDPARLF